MAKAPEKPQRVTRVSELQDTKVNITSDARIQIEFRIDDLIKRVTPGGFNPGVANCGGCHGCMGCSM
jgi:hypothetical protein